MDKKTPLYDTHLKYGGKMVTFGGYLLPVQYSGVIEEHMAVRTRAGLFDVSHMGEFTCSGTGAAEFLNHVLTNNYSTLKPGSARYSPMCNEHGGTVDDLIVYCRDADSYFIVVNAANREKDFNWMREHLTPDCTLKDVSDSFAQLALQGPSARDIMLKLLPEDSLPVKGYTALFDVSFHGVPAIISKTGYTGEDGYELYIPSDQAEKIWELLMEAGKEYGLLPCGLGARDTLRLEAGMALYGHELSDTISPLEAGLEHFVKMDKTDFIGKTALEAEPPKRGRVGLKITGRGIPREHMDVYSGTRLVGQTTSGTYCPFLKRAAAMALLDTACTAPGTPLDVDVRGRRVAVEVESLPFYKRSKK